MLLYHSNAGGAIFPIIFFARGRKIRSTDVQRDVMTMEKTLRALQGLPVVCAGKRVGRVAQAALSDDLRRMDGLWVDAGLGGARFVPICTPEYRQTLLSEIAEKLTDPERNLPGGLIYYSDLIFNPETALSLGYCMASLFTDAEPDVVMTSEVKGIPIAMFAAYALGVPLAVCRFRNRPSDGAAVGVHYPTASGDVKTMYIGTRQMRRGCRVLIVDDFMRGGSTASGMLLMAKQFDAEVAGIGVFIAYDEPKEKSVPNYHSLLTLKHNAEGQNRLVVTPGKE